MATIEDIKSNAQLVKNATAVGENTAERVGGVLTDMAEFIEDTVTAKTVAYDKLDTIGFDQLTTENISKLEEQAANGAPLRYHVAPSANGLPEGVLEVWLDSMAHVVVEKITTSAVLDASSQQFTGSHTDFTQSTYIRYLNINAPSSPVGALQWTKWQIYESTNVSGYRYALLLPDNPPTTSEKVFGIVDGGTEGVTLENYLDPTGKPVEIEANTIGLLLSQWDRTKQENRWLKGTFPSSKQEVSQIQGNVTQLQNDISQLKTATDDVNTSDVDVTPNKDSVDVIFKDVNHSEGDGFFSDDKTFTLPAATEESAGVMTAEDKAKLNKSVGKVDPNSDGTGEIFNDYENNKATGKYAHAEGIGCEAPNYAAHAEGVLNIANADFAHAEGNNTTDVLDFVVSSISSDGKTVTGEIDGTYDISLKEGDKVYITSEGNFKGIRKVISWNNENQLVFDKSIGTIEDIGGDGGYIYLYSQQTYDMGEFAHAEGRATAASSYCSHTEGWRTEAQNNFEHAQGSYNKSNTGSTTADRTIHSIGIGYGEEDRKNAVEVMANGDAYIIGVGGYDGTNPQSAQTLQETLSNISIESVATYGIEFDTEISTPACTRIGNAELHRTLPVHNLMRGCLLDDDGKVVEYLPKDNWTSATRDGSKGQVMVEIPEHWWKFETDGTKRRVRLSAVPISGYIHVAKYYISAYEAALDRTNNKLASVVNLTEQYRGGNNNAEWDGTYRSLLGMPATSISHTDFRTYARNRKEGSYDWNMYTYHAHKDLYWLFVTEYATLNSQAAFNSALTAEGYKQGGLGNGVTILDDDKWDTFNSRNPFIPCGHTDELGNGTGEVEFSMPTEYDSNIKTVKVPRYRGIENPFGHIWKIVDGINVRVSPDSPAGDGLNKVFVSYDTSKFNSVNYEGYNYIGNEVRKNGYINEVIFGEAGEIIPLTAIGSNTTYFCDYSSALIGSYEELHSIYFGSRSNMDAMGGIVSQTSNSTPSNKSIYIGTRLCFIPNTNK